MAKSMDEHLKEIGASEDLREIVTGISQTCVAIREGLQSNLVKLLGSRNAFGDEQISSDLLAENLLRKWAKGCTFVKAISSEEDPTLNELKEHNEGTYIICWDPLDGSSIMDCNWSVGSIFAIWKINENGLSWKGADTLIGATGRQQVCSMMAVYGPRLTILVSLNKATYDYTYVDNKFILTHERKIQKDKAKTFAPANLRCNKESTAYKNLLDFWLDKKYTLRYSGGLVPDVYHIFVKGQGVFCNPASEQSPAKLRLIFESIPIAFITENAQGKSSNGHMSLLDKPIEKMDERTALCVGTEEEVLRFENEIRKEKN